MSNEDKKSEETATKKKGVCQQTLKRRSYIMKQASKDMYHIGKVFGKKNKKYPTPTREDIEKSILHSKKKCSGLQDLFETFFFTKKFLGFDLDENQKKQTASFFEKMEFNAIIFQGMSLGKKLGEILGLDKGALEAIYDQGYTQFLAGNYRKARSIFDHLGKLEPQVYKYNFAHAAAMHKEEEYFGAVHMYALAATLDPDNPAPFYHSIDCSLKMENYISAITYLDMALKKCKGNPKYKKIEEKCKNIENYFKEHYYKKPKKKKGSSNE
jgi:type III secretion system low calcium response chaperone LcrH/SycD